MKSYLIIVLMFVLSACNSKSSPGGNGSVKLKNGPGWVMFGTKGKLPYFVLITELDVNDFDESSSGGGSGGNIDEQSVRGYWMRSGSKVVEYQARYLDGQVHVEINGEKFDSEPGTVFVLSKERKVLKTPYLYRGDAEDLPSDKVIYYILKTSMLD